MSTLLSISAQTFRDFDVYFLLQKGNGPEGAVGKFSAEFKKYHELARTYGINTQLDPYHADVVDAIKVAMPSARLIEYQNDHGLDSGAWYKFIKQGLWREYENTLFIGEGALLTRSSTLEDTLQFMKENGAHFVTGSQDKRRVSRSRFVGGFASEVKTDALRAFHDEMIAKTFEIFKRDSDFMTRAWDQWSTNQATEQQCHVPDVWGPGLSWFRLNSLAFSSNGSQSLWREGIKKFVWKYHSKKVRSETVVIREGTHVFANGKAVARDQVVHAKRFGRHFFHSEDDVAWYGACCNHFLSREFLERLSQRLEKHALYDVLDLPYSATALEPLWGMIPAWLGYKKWFFDGIHRVRKHFTNYRREDDAEGMAWYTNLYYQKLFAVSPKPRGLRVLNWSSSLSLKESLNDVYF